jgi:hypothetical protein
MTLLHRHQRENLIWSLLSTKMIALIGVLAAVPRSRIATIFVTETPEDKHQCNLALEEVASEQTAALAIANNALFYKRPVHRGIWSHLSLPLPITFKDKLQPQTCLDTY